MIFALILLFAVAISFFVSPLIAIAVFILGVVGFLVLVGMRRSEEEGGASADPGSRAARRFRREGRETRIR